jgi:hypothetical protein
MLNFIIGIVLGTALTNLIWYIYHDYHIGLVRSVVAIMMEDGFRIPQHEKENDERKFK